ncbi:MAG: hypothetical protein DWQ47_08645 [Acidobacteria bacterium]|nr:MAG: hypothetical protein DWQ32_16745 [Acidobacteriota bacterium]REJ99023.1 MAG: hypothetical protein DWQ38_13235 [Acidobacteriota bacterium]REK16256.1 MAG: hypothetical protein DWQ43_04455 [Acidobacteriota bacterium]REK43937.1 MAG: hypothetical protein DWQ47_08645 [Acidobacteriota bacterium]
MEAELNKLMKELEAMRAELDADEKGGPAVEERPPADVKADSRPEPVQEKLGVDLGKGIRLVPYGTVYFNAFGNSSGTNNTDVPLWATGDESSNLGMSLRQTRFGVRIEGGRLGGGTATGTIEADFYGGLPDVGVGENFGVVRLRVAKLRIDWERSSVTFGQDWVVFAPRNPTSIAAAAIPQFAASGNLWSRLPQVRAAQRLAGGSVLVEAAVLAPTSGDFPQGPDSSFVLQPGAASRSLVPSLQTRAEFRESDWFNTGKPAAVAVSVHFGRTKVGDRGLASYGVAADWSVPITDRVGTTGELFYGKNLGGFQGGVFQGYNPDHVADPHESSEGIPKAIASRGGWVQLGYTPPILRDRLSIYGSVGIDDPDDNDLVNTSSRNFRSRNLSYAFNVIFKPIPNISVGGEFRRFETSYLLTGQKKAEHLNFGASYSF